MHVLVTGATGFVGRALVPRLLRDGHTVAVWVRNPASARSLLGDVISVVSASGGLPAMTAAVAQADGVINLAGESVAGGRWSAARKQLLTASRLDLSGLIVDAIEGATRRPRVLVSASAVGLYGDSAEVSNDEQSLAGPGFLAELCVAWEAVAQRAEGLGVRVVLPRIGVVLGPEGGALQKMLPIFRMGLGGPIAGGRQWMSWIHLDDLVESLVFALGHKALSGPYNAVAPVPVRNADFTRSLGAALGRPAALPVPAFAIRTLMGEAASIVVGGQRVFPRGLQRAGFSFQFNDIVSALRACLG